MVADCTGSQTNGKAALWGIRGCWDGKTCFAFKPVQHVCRDLYASSRTMQCSCRMLSPDCCIFVSSGSVAGTLARNCCMQQQPGIPEMGDTLPHSKTASMFSIKYMISIRTHTISGSATTRAQEDSTPLPPHVCTHATPQCRRNCSQTISTPECRSLCQ
jgi:hypothetical protein